MPSTTSTDCTGPTTLNDILGDPRFTLTFYNQLVLFSRHDTDPDKRTEYAVDPEEIRRALKTVDTTFNSDFLPPDIIWVQKRANKTTVASYRPPQITGIWLEGVDDALHVPMPGLLLLHTAAAHSSRIFALDKPPTSELAALFAAPLPNTSSATGSICWGTVAIPALDAPNDLTPIWQTLLGSPFINHSVNDKSRKHPGDIRKLLIELHEQQAADYPLDDLVPAQSQNTLKRALAIGTD